MKNLLLKLRTVLVVVLLVAAAVGIVELLTLLRGLAINDNGTAGTVAFAAIALVFIGIVIYLIVKKPKNVYSEKEASKQSLLKENMQNEINKKL